MKDIKINPLIPDWSSESLYKYFMDVAKIPPLSIEEEEALIKRIEEGDQDAVQELVKANLRFVITVAKQYQSSGYELADLIQEGNLALIRAVQKYDHSKGFRFISYAVWWIRQAIIKTISDNCRTVRLPVNKINSARQLNNISDKFEQENERLPSFEELSELSGIDEKNVKFIMGGINKTTSLETPINESLCIGDTLSSEDKEYDESSLTKKMINQIIEKLPPMKKEIIRLSFGIGVPKMSKKEIGKKFGVCEERIRQIQNKTLAQIKRRYSKKLKDLL